MYLCDFVIIFPWKRASPFIRKKLNSLLPRMLCAKFGWHWPSVLEKKIFFNFVNVFSLFRYYPPLEKGVALRSKKHESPSHKDAFCQVLVEIGPVVLRRRFLRFVNVFSLFLNNLPLEKGVVLHLNKFESPSTQGRFVPSSVEIGRLVLKKRICKVRQCIFAISLLSPLRKGCGPSF